MRLSAAVVGLGYWGPNIVRNLVSSKDFALTAVCDVDPARLERVGSQYPSVSRHGDLDSLLRREAPQLVAIATPVATHFGLAMRALEAGCHVLLEKPLTRSVQEAEELLRVAAERHLHVCVDHTFLFTGAVQEIHRQVSTGALGGLLYVDSVRIALGLFQPDVDVIWDLAPHDLAILGHVLGRQPTAVRALGASHNPKGTVDVAHLHLDYGPDLQAHLHLSWLSPVKIRRMVFAGRRQSLIFDDLEPAEKVKLYDHGVDFDEANDDLRHEILISYRKGDMRAPALPVTEALAAEMRHLAEVLRGEAEPIASGQAGLEVVRALEAASESLRNGGTPCAIRA